VGIDLTDAATTDRLNSDAVGDRDKPEGDCNHLTVAPTTVECHAEHVFDEQPTGPELLAMWREATQAAELAERLAFEAAERLGTADQKAVDAGALAALAEQASEAADRAAVRAREVAAAARALAGQTRGAGEAAKRDLAAAQLDVSAKRGLESTARNRYMDRGPDEA
jgi:hypothetical protein